MTARYGDRTRVTSQVKTWGKDVDAAVGAKEPYEEIFTAPGTWTWPGNVDTVEVTLVGGGGGGGAASDPVFRGGGGGGGGVRIEQSVPVFSPVPVLVGAGGIAGVYNATPTNPVVLGGVGGSSSFGPISVGGGGGSANTVSDSSAPPDGGGGAGQRSSPGVTLAGGNGGLYGYPGGVSVHPDRFAGGGGGANSTASNGNFRADSSGQGIKGFGGGGGGGTNIDLFGPTSPIRGQLGHYASSYAGAGRGSTGSTFGIATVIQNAEAGKVNTGGGGGGGTPTPAPFAAAREGASGGSGIVIVRWWE